ncbi:MAG: PilN domain-containing protein [Candidatus Beckwithbacteria bacterium]
MPARKKERKEINLLPKDPWEVGLLGKLVKWVLTVGKYVVVFVELAVILAFLFRFSLDRKLTDLNEKIKQKVAVVVSFGDFEAKFRQVQQQLEVVKTAETESLKVTEVLDELSLITPMDAIYDSITINNEEVGLQGVVLSETGLATLLSKAQESQKFSGVSLESVDSSKSNISGIIFKMTLEYKNK